MKKNRLYILFVLPVAFLLSACEDEITLDLGEVTPQLVIEGIVTDQPGPYQVELSKTVNYYENNDFPPQTGALVSIEDDAGNSEQLIEVEPGLYQTNLLQGVRGRTYTLNVTYEGETHSASSKIPEQQISLDSIIVRFEDASLFFDEGYFATAYFEDPVNIENFYRLNFFVNGEPYVWNEDDEDQDNIEDDNFWLWSDKYSDGNTQDYEFLQRLDLNDTVYIELHHLDQPTYDYYRTLVESRDPGGLAPANPISNFGSDVLGYFGAFSVTSNEVAVEE